MSLSKVRKTSACHQPVLDTWPSLRLIVDWNHVPRCPVAFSLLSGCTWFHPLDRSHKKLTQTSVAFETSSERLTNIQAISPQFVTQRQSCVFGCPNTCLGVVMRVIVLIYNLAIWVGVCGVSRCYRASEHAFTGVAWFFCLHTRPPSKQSLSAILNVHVLRLSCSLDSENLRSCCMFIGLAVI